MSDEERTFRMMTPEECGKADVLVKQILDVLNNSDTSVPVDLAIACSVVASVIASHSNTTEHLESGITGSAGMIASFAREGYAKLCKERAEEQAANACKPLPPEVPAEVSVALLPGSERDENPASPWAVPTG